MVSYNKRKRNSQATRKRILETAERIFAEEGFDAARVDRIAGEAEVNKALIYYYFKSKQAILDELLDDFIQTANGFLIEMARQSYAFGSPEMLRQMQKYNDYLLRRDTTLRLLLTESLKDSREVPPLFKLIDLDPASMDEKAAVAAMNERGFHLDTDEQQRRVTEFFTGIMPTIVYSLFRSKWCRYFDIEQDKLDELFRKANEETHYQHHLK